MVVPFLWGGKERHLARMYFQAEHLKAYVKKIFKKAEKKIYVQGKNKSNLHKKRRIVCPFADRR